MTHAPTAVSGKALLDVRRLQVRFGEQTALRGLDLQLHAGETLALVGESGCGKSTTALALMRLLPPQARLGGEIRFEGRDLLALDERRMRGLRGSALAMIFQEPMTSLNPVLSVGAQVAEALRLHEPMSAAAAARRAVELLELVRLSEPQRRFASHPHQLSGGQRQRVMIAMAVACRPRLLIADEPTTALDVTIQAQILELLTGLQREFGMALLLITHDLGLVAQWADRVIVMHDGRALETGPVATVLRAPAHPYTQGLLGASLHIDRALHYRDTRLPEIVVRPARDGDGVAFELRRPAPLAWPAVPTIDAGRAAPLLAVRDLHTRYDTPQGPVHAVDGVSFDIGPGETVGLVGESGCGKSSLSRTIVRLETPAAGQILLGGTDLAPLDRAALRPHRRRVQMVFQDPYGSLNPRQSVLTILDTAQRLHGQDDSRERERRAERMLDRVGLPRNALRRYPHEFSGGQRQRIGIARALVLQPDLLICDEPVSALDVSVQAQILNLLVELKAELGLTYLFISHDLAVVRYIADRVLVMNAGRIVESGTTAQVWTAPRHAYTRGLIAAVPTAPTAPIARPPRAALA